MEKVENQIVDLVDKDAEEGVNEFDDPIVECRHCGNHPCFGIEMEPLLLSILQTYGEWKSSKQVRFLVYGEATKHIHGTGLGKGVRKKLPN